MGFDGERLNKIDAAIDRAIELKQVPGAVVLVGRRGAIAYAHAAGRRVVGPVPEALTRDTIFDMASLTKPIATATSVMILIEDGKLRLSDRVVRFLPEFDNHGKGAVTIEQLLRHRAASCRIILWRITSRDPTRLGSGSPSSTLSQSPASDSVYSDVGFEILGKWWNESVAESSTSSPRSGSSIDWQ